MPPGAMGFRVCFLRMTFYIIVYAVQNVVFSLRVKDFGVVCKIGKYAFFFKCICNLGGEKIFADAYSSMHQESQNVKSSVSILLLRIHLI